MVSLGPLVRGEGGEKRNSLAYSTRRSLLPAEERGERVGMGGVG